MFVVYDIVSRDYHKKPFVYMKLWPARVERADN